MSKFDGVKFTAWLSNIEAEPFKMKMVRQLIDKYIDLRTRELEFNTPLIVDPFARECFLTNGNYNAITNDLNPEFKTDYNMEANDFGELLLQQKTKIDLIVFDPPYTLGLLKTHYEGIGEDLKLWQTRNMWGRGKDALAACVQLGGYVISLGYHTHGFGKHRGFKKREIITIEQAGNPDKYNLLVTVEKKTQTDLFKFK